MHSLGFAVEVQLTRIQQTLYRFQSAADQVKFAEKMTPAERIRFLVQSFRSEDEEEENLRQIDLMKANSDEYAYFGSAC